MESADDKLKAYAKEMGINSGSISLDQLIESHRSMRSDRQRSEAEKRAEMQVARERAAQQATEEVKNLGWFSVERLRGMTLAELAELIRED